MENVIVSVSEPVVLVGGGPVGNHDISRVLKPGYRLVACDGGAGHVRAAGLDARLEAIVGDMDSLAGDEWPKGLCHEIAEQDTTDFDKALRSVQSPLVLALGVWGGRADHTLACLSVLAAHPGRAVLVDAGEDCLFLMPPRIALSLEAGARVSLWPLAEVGGRSRGLRWPIDGLRLSPCGRIGTSNEAVDGEVVIEMAGPVCFGVLPIRYRAEVARALLAAPRWPVRAG